MTEAETMATLANLGEVIYAGVDTWLAVTFGYLTVAYFIGNKLTRFQCFAVSVLYSVVALLYAIALPIHTHAWALIMLREKTVYDETWLADSVLNWVAGGTFFFIVGTFVSLYFMYNVRHPKEALR